MDLNIRIGDTVFLCDILCKCRDHLFDLAALEFSCKNDPCLGFSGNRVVTGSAVEVDQADFTCLLKTVEKTGQQDTCVCSADADTLAGMTAAKSLDGEFKDFSGFFTPSAGQCADLLCAACTGSSNDPLLFGIQIEHRLPHRL